MSHEFRKGITIPEDTGPHSHSNIEWWYYFAFLKGEKGGRYAVMASFFQVGEWDIGKGHYLIYTIIDLNTHKSIHFSGIDTNVKRSMILFYLPVYLFLNPLDRDMWSLYKKLLLGDIPRPHALLDKVKIMKNPLQLQFGKNELTFKKEKTGAFDTNLRGENEEIKLSFTPLKSIAQIGENGKPDDLYYYSFTKNAVEGFIENKNGKERVSGTGWFDHQWGRDYQLASGGGWNWFGLQLDDGRELLLNKMMKKDTGSEMANMIDTDGSLYFTRNITFTPTRYWKSLKSNSRYPIEWAIEIPELAMELQVKPAYPNQELPIIGPLKAIWEGACLVTGKEILKDGTKKQIKGKGFMELVGYATK